MIAEFNNISKAFFVLGAITRGLGGFFCFKLLVMKVLLSKIACLFGFHDWVYDKETVVKCNRECKRCNKSQYSVYDMGYGETVWIDGKHW